MNDFTASNGVRVQLDQLTDGAHRLTVSKGGLDEYIIGAPRVQSLREFFQAEQDQHLGRWRWPEDPGYLVYRMLESRVRVLDEASGKAVEFTRADVSVLRVMTLSHLTEHAGAADAFFTENPRKMPWHDAKPGEVWALRLNDGEDEDLFYRHGDGEFYFRNGDSIPGRLRITNGRRIWPEVAS